MFQQSEVYETIIQMLERDFRFGDYQNNKDLFTPEGNQKIIKNDEIGELLDLFFKALDMDKAVNFEGLDDLKECIIREFSEDITHNEQIECFQRFSRAEQVVKHFLYLTNPSKWAQVESDIKKTMVPCLRMLDVIPPNYNSQSVDLAGDADSVYDQIKVQSDYPYLEHVARVYQWRNQTSHNAPVPNRRQLPTLEESFWFFYLYIVKLHKDELRKRIETREHQSFARIEYCRKLVESYDTRNRYFKYFDFKWTNRAANTCTSIESTMTMDNNACLMFGEAGSGKSVALSRLCYLAAKKHIEDPAQPIPVLIELKSLTAKDRILSEIPRILHCTDEECDTLLNSGHILLFLDGVNEIVSWEPNRATVQLQREFIKEIASLFNHYTRTKVWISDRAMTNFGEDARREIVKLELQKITQQDIIRFCKNTTTDAAVFDSMTLPEGVVSFLNTPFKIQCFCKLLSQTHFVPDSEIQLIGKYLEMIIEREYSEKGTLNLKSTWIFHEILETLSAEINRQNGSISVFRARNSTLQVLKYWHNYLDEVDNCLKIAQELKILLISNDRVSFCSEKYFAYFLANHAKKLAEEEDKHVGADILNSCGFTEDQLLEASPETVDTLKYMMEIAFSDKDREGILKYLLQVNCYLAAQCCITLEDRDFVFREYENSNSLSNASQCMAEYHRVLALYYLEQYDAARSYIDLCFDKRDDQYKKTFYAQILEIGFHKSKDQAYFLCHCFNGVSFFHIHTLLELVRQYNWKCPIDDQEQYYPDFHQLIAELLYDKHYSLLYNLLFVLGENKEQAKQIILKSQGWSSAADLLNKLRKLNRENSTLQPKLDPQLYDRTVLELEFVRGNVKSSYYYKKIEWILKVHRENPSPEITTSSITRSLFLLAAQHACVSGDANAFLLLKNHSFEIAFLLEDDFLMEYLRQLTDIMTVILKKKNATALEKLEFINIFSQKFNFDHVTEEQLEKIQEVLWREIFTDTFKQTARQLLQHISIGTEERFYRLYEDTYLYDLFPEDEIKQIVQTPEKQQEHIVDKDEPQRFTVELIYGADNEFSFSFRCEGMKYIGYRIPSGVYSVKWQYDEKNSMISVYEGDAVEGMEVSPDDYPVNICMLSQNHIEIKEEQYITLSEGSCCILTRQTSAD